MKMIPILFIVIILMVSFVSAEQTQQFNKIFLDPFYRPSMIGATPYSYTLEINPPDRISEVKSAIITFQLWLNPTIEFFLKVNGQDCNTPSYEVHTTYAGAGEGTIFFDCSNVITKAGTYNIVLTPDDNTGAVTGWIDMTYQSKPETKVDLFGTDYSPNDNGTIFLQLLDDDRQAVSDVDATCYITSWYPDKSSYLNNVLMNYLEDGLFYYDITIPSQLGVYMMSGSCSLPSQAFNDDFLDEDDLELSVNVSTSGNLISLLAGSEELPDNRGIDTTANMTGNLLLMHFNDESGAIADTSGDNNNGTYNGVLYSQSGAIDTALGFDGTGDYMTIPHNESFDSLTDHFSIAFWVKPHVYHGGYKRVIEKSYSTSWAVALDDGNQISFWANGGELLDTGTHQILPNNWTHVAITWDRVIGTEQVKVYFDGEHVANTSYSTPFGTDTRDIYVGQYYGGGAYWFDGDLDELAIWNRTLSPTEVTNLYGRRVVDITPTTYGYILSNPITLNNNNWETFSSTYDEKEGDITFQILNSSNDVLCDGLGDISSCANVTSPIKLYANLSRTNISSSSPEIDRWTISWNEDTIQEIKGAGELNVRNWGGGSAEVNETAIAEAVWNWDGVISNNIISQFVNAVWSYSGSIVANILNQVSDTVWTRTERDLTYYEGSDLTAEDVWEYAERNLTYYETGSMNITVNGTDIAEQVWNYGGTINNNVLNQVADKVQCYLNQLLTQEDDEWAINIPVC